MMELERLEEILDQAPAKRILVIGDLMLDEFVWGKVGRISPEAPVPVVEVTGQSFYPGGAANVARNLCEFINQVSIAGRIGRDASGAHLRDLLARQKIDITHLLEDGNFPTIVKTRIIARHQQVVRVDRENVASPGADQITKVVGAVHRALPEIDAVIFEDYGKGFLVADLVSQIARDARLAGKITAADPNPRNLIDWRGMTVVKPNRTEAFLAAGLAWSEPAKSPEQDRALAQAGRTLLEKWDAESILITLGEDGMLLFQKDQTAHHIPTKARDVFDVSGAGDTAIALFTLGLACNATPLEAAEIANHGSAVVVGKLGTATVTRDELIQSFKHDSS
jgi:D-beta-D-heptose 7-phosphate kinase/D-beta-D-heptose 1-phosphate adenosyltransferase